LHPSVEQLLKVQEVDSQILFLRESLRLRPLELEDDRRKVVDTKKNLEGALLEIKKGRMDSDRREVDVKKADAEIDKLNVALNQAKTNQEYTIFKEQIKRQEEQRGKAEEEVIEKLTQLDSLESTRKALATKLEMEERSFRKKESEVQEIVKGIKDQLQVLEATRGELMSGIDREHLRTYERVLQRHNNFAIARVESQVCHGCFMSVTTQEVNLLMQGQLLQCKSCSRLLYLG
jgi:hypothetical protein